MGCKAAEWSLLLIIMNAQCLGTALMIGKKNDWFVDFRCQ